MRRAIAIMLALVGCQSGVPAEIPLNPAIVCLEGLVDAPQFAPIRTRVYLGVTGRQPAGMMAQGGRVTEAEKPPLLAWIKAHGACFVNSRIWVQSHYNRRVLSWAAGTEGHFQTLAGDLYRGTITYGEFAKRRAALATDQKNELAAILRREYASDEAIRGAPPTVSDCLSTVTGMRCAAY
jgi:hypothetical protein